MNTVHTHPPVINHSSQDWNAGHVSAAVPLKCWKTQFFPEIYMIMYLLAVLFFNLRHKHAIYTLQQSVIGLDVAAHWTNPQPLRRKQISISHLSIFFLVLAPSVVADGALAPVNVRFRCKISFNPDPKHSHVQSLYFRSKKTTKSSARILD